MYHSFSLSLVDTIPGDFIAYRPPIANQYVSRQDTTISYFYIAATNGDTQIAGTGSISPTSQDGDLLRIRFDNTLVSTSGLNVILNQDALNVDTTTTVNYTIVGKYMYIYIYVGKYMYIYVCIVNYIIFPLFTYYFSFRATKCHRLPISSRCFFISSF